MEFAKGYKEFNQIAFSPDNAFIVTSVMEGTGQPPLAGRVPPPPDASIVIVWSRRTGEKVSTFQPSSPVVLLSRRTAG